MTQAGEETLDDNVQKEESILDRMVDYGMLGYSLEKIARCEGMKLLDLKLLFVKDPMAEKVYEKAKAQREYQFDLKVMNLAMSGDINALKMLQDRLAKQEMDEVSGNEF